MKIECLLKREDGTRVTFDAWPNEQFPDVTAPDAEYHFKPVDRKNPRSPHVADVTNEHHAARLLSISTAYRFFDDGSTGAGFERPSVPAPQPRAAAPVIVIVPDAASPADPAKVAAVRELSVKELKKQINTFDDATLRAALVEEKGNKADAPRKTWIEVVEAQLGNEEEEEEGGSKDD